MPSLIQGFEYDVFISYRQNDNRSGWVTKFVEDLREELAATLKDPINIYFDENPHDGLLDTHDVSRSLGNKLRCLIFLPVLSRTYCDLKSYAWNEEFLAFLSRAKRDAHGLYVKVEGNNVAGRVLPILIHDLDPNDRELFEREIEGTLRAADFRFLSPGVNRPLLPDDKRQDNLSRTVYRDQINKTANAIAEIMKASLQGSGNVMVEERATSYLTPDAPNPKGWRWVFTELIRRNVFRAGFAYIAASWVLGELVAPMFLRTENATDLLKALLVGGFPLAMIFAWLYERSPSGMIRTNSEASVSNPYSPSQKKPFTNTWIIITLVVLLVVQRYGEEVFTKEKSIAVLPFESLSTEKGDEYFAIGLTDDIITRLAIISRLRVISRGSITDYRGKGLDYKTIASELGVENLVIGTVQRTGTTVKVSARLINGRTQESLWGEVFSREFKDFLSLQGEISRRIADHLKVRLSELENRKLGTLQTQSYTAFDYYTQGRGYYNEYNRVDNDKAIASFKNAILIDSTYALAWAGLGDAYSQMDRLGLGKNWLDSSISAGTKAIQLDSSLSEAYKALANAYNYQRKFDIGFELLKKAVQLNPNNASAVANLGTGYFNRGMLVDALRWFKKAASIHPRSFATYQVGGWTYRLLGDYNNASLWLEKSLKLNSSIFDTYEQLGYTYVCQGRREKALELVEPTVNAGPDDPRALEAAGLISHFAGERNKARSYFEQSISNNDQYSNDPNTIAALGLGQILMSEGDTVDADIYLSKILDVYLREVETGSQSFNPRFYISAVYAIRGDAEKSNEWLQKAIDMGWNDHMQITLGHWFGRIQNDGQLLSKVEFVKERTKKMRSEASRF